MLWRFFLVSVHSLDKMFRGQTYERTATGNIGLHIAVKVLY